MDAGSHSLSAQIRHGGPWRTVRLLLLWSEPVRGYLQFSPTLIVLSVTMALPFGLMLLYSVWTQSYLDVNTTATLANYQAIGDKPLFSALFARSLWISGSTTIWAVVLAYPLAYYVAFHVRKNKIFWLILLTLPFLTSYLLRIFAWKVILGYGGVINSSLGFLGLISEPIPWLMYSPMAVTITLVHAWLPFAVMPIFVSLEKIDRTCLEAANDLGLSNKASFFRVTLPLSIPGIVAASLMIFIPTVGEYVTPVLVGGPDGLMIANYIQVMFGRANNWPLGAATAIVMMGLITLCSVGFLLLMYTIRRGAR